MYTLTLIYDREIKGFTQMTSIPGYATPNPYGTAASYPTASTPYGTPQQGGGYSSGQAPAYTAQNFNPFQAYASQQHPPGANSAYPAPAYGDPQTNSYGSAAPGYSTGYPTGSHRPNPSPWGQYADPYAQQHPPQAQNPFAEKAGLFNDRANLNNFQANQFAFKQPMGADALTAVGGNKDLSILNSAVGAAGLGDSLQKLEKDGPITILAPTDKAFGKLPPELAKALALPENRPILQQILLYHVGGAAHEFGKQPMVFDSFAANDQNVIIGNAVQPSVVNGQQVVQGSGSAFRTENNSVVIPISDLLIPPGLDLSKLKMPGQGQQPGTPTTPGTPAVPGTPTTPTTPGTPAVPGMPTTPTTPGTPTVPGMPTTPTTPGTPAVPGMPTTPTTPGAPAVPGMPTTPTTPGTPAVPGTPTTPPMTGYPTVGGMAPQATSPMSNIYGQPVAQTQAAPIQSQAFMGTYNMGTSVV
jgi:uncharacterized surface protein with fasciclin (FAS1) repeats